MHSRFDRCDAGREALGAARTSNQAHEISKRRRRLRTTRRALGSAEGMAELSVFWREEAIAFYTTAAWTMSRLLLRARAYVWQTHWNR